MVSYGGLGGGGFTGGARGFGFPGGPSGAGGGDLCVNCGKVEIRGAGAEGFGLGGGEGLAEAEGAQDVDVGFDPEGGGADEVGGRLAVDGDDLGAQFFDAGEDAGGLFGKFAGGDEGDAHGHVVRRLSGRVKGREEWRWFAGIKRTRRRPKRMRRGRCGRPRRSSRR